MYDLSLPLSWPCMHDVPFHSRAPEASDCQLPGMFLNETLIASKARHRHLRCSATRAGVVALQELPKRLVAFSHAFRTEESRGEPWAVGEKEGNESSLVYGLGVGCSKQGPML